MYNNYKTQTLDYEQSKIIIITNKSETQLIEYVNIKVET